MIELAVKIFSEDGIIALVLIAVLAILGLMVYVLLQLVKQKSSSEQIVTTQATVIAQLVSPMKEITEQLKLTSESLTRVVEMMREHDTRVNTMREMLDHAVSNMHESVNIRHTQLETLPERVRKEMANDFERIPKAVDDILTQKVEMLTQDIKALIQELDEKLSTRIDALPIKTVGAMRQELAELSELIDKSLQQAAKPEDAAEE